MRTFILAFAIAAAVAAAAVHSHTKHDTAKPGLKLEWQLNLSVSTQPANASTTTGYAALFGTDNKFYTANGADGSLIVVDTMSGKIQFQFNEWDCNSTAAAVAACWSRQTIGTDRIVTVFQGDWIWKLDALTGERSATSVPSEIIAAAASLSLAVGDIAVLFDGTTLLAFNTTNPAQTLWSRGNMGNPFGSSTRVDSETGNIAIVQNSSLLPGTWSVLVLSAAEGAALFTYDLPSNAAFAYVSWVSRDSLLFLYQDASGNEYTCRMPFGSEKPGPRFCTRVVLGGSADSYVTGYGLSRPQGGSADPTQMYCATLRVVYAVNFTTGSLVSTSPTLPTVGSTHLVGLAKFASITYVDQRTGQLCTNGYDFASGKPRFNDCFNTTSAVANQYNIATNYNNEIFVPTGRGFYFVFGETNDIEDAYANAFPSGTLTSSVWVTGDALFFASGNQLHKFSFKRS